MHLYTDASDLGFWIFLDGHWVSEPWPSQFQPPSTSVEWRELLPIFVACTIWGNQWYSNKILFHCYNQCVVDFWVKGTSKCPKISHLLRQLFFITAKHSFSIHIVHIPGKINKFVDRLSRLQIEQFLKMASTGGRPHTNSSPSMTLIVADMAIASST